MPKIKSKTHLPSDKKLLALEEDLGLLPDSISKKIKYKAMNDPSFMKQKNAIELLFIGAWKDIRNWWSNPRCVMHDGDFFQFFVI